MARDPRQTDATASPGTAKAARALVAVLMVACFAVRYFAATTVPMPYDEAQLVKLSDRIQWTSDGPRLPTHVYPHRHLAGQLYLGKLGTLVVGHNIMGFRIASIVLGTATCWMVFALVRRVWGLYPALLSLFLLTFNGFHIGVSIFAVERTYLFFTMLGIYFFWRAIDEDRPVFLTVSGAVLCAGAVVSEHTLLLLPAFAAFLALSRVHRRWLARWETWAAVLMTVLVCIGLVYVYASGSDPAGGLRDDYGDHAGRLGRFGLGVGPLALYIAPLYYFVSDRISVYPVMCLASGILLLAGVIRAHFAIRDEFTRLLLVIFWLFVGGFSFFTGPRPEFKWAATSLFAAAPLAAHLLWSLWQRRTAYGAISCIPLAYIVGFALWTANASFNCYYSPLVSPSKQMINDQVLKHGLYLVTWMDYNFADLTESPLFPARYTAYYAERYRAYASFQYFTRRDPRSAWILLERAAQIDDDHPHVRWLADVISTDEALRQRRSARSGDDSQPEEPRPP